MADDNHIYSIMAEMVTRNEPFVVATVISVKGSSSGKPGDKALFDRHGHRITGWVGGGCVEKMISDIVPEVLTGKTPRTIHVDLNSDNLLMGIPCGGEMDLIIEPKTDAPGLYIRGMGRVVETLAEMAMKLGFRVTVHTPAPEADRFKSVHQLLTTQTKISELTEMPGYAILADHHPDDTDLAREALEAGIGYVAVIASRKRAGLIKEAMKEQGIDESLFDHLFMPAGINLNAQSPEEIALSILAEIIMLRNEGSGDSLKLAH